MNGTRNPPKAQRYRPRSRPRLLTLKTACLMDVAGSKVARTEIAMINIIAPAMACQAIDWAIQAHGHDGLSDDLPLAFAYAGARVLRLAEGPDEVHRSALTKLELEKYSSFPYGATKRPTGSTTVVQQ